MKIAFVCPLNGISGGLYIVYKQAHFLQSRGHDVHIIFSDPSLGKEVTCYPGFACETRFLEEAQTENYDRVIATWWKTFYEMFSLKADRYFYFVQSDERRFYPPDDPYWPWIEWTYRNPHVSYVTESRWIQHWLKRDEGWDVAYAPNGVDTTLFHPGSRHYPDRIRTILIEGPVGQDLKRLPESYRVTERLRERFPEIKVILVTSDKTSEVDAWKLDAVYEKVPWTRMPDIYRSADLLLKLSSVEGFVGPPLEAMACGCVSVATKTTGHDEYLVHDKNSLLVDVDDFEGAYQAAVRLIEDSDLAARLRQAGFATAKALDWKNRSFEFEKALGDRRSGSTMCDKTKELKIIQAAAAASSESIQRFRQTKKLHAELPLQILACVEGLSFDEWMDLRRRQFEGWHATDRVLWWAHAGSAPSWTQDISKHLTRSLSEHFRLWEGPVDSLMNDFLKTAPAHALVACFSSQDKVPTAFWSAARNALALHPEAQAVVPSFWSEDGFAEPVDSDVVQGLDRPSYMLLRAADWREPITRLVTVPRAGESPRSWLSRAWVRLLRRLKR